MKKLKKGMIIHSCAGYNNKIQNIDKDGDTITFIDGSRCSWSSCCGFAKSKKEIVEYLLGWSKQPPGERQWGSSKFWALCDGLAAGEDLIDEKGMVRE